MPHSGIQKMSSLPEVVSLRSDPKMLTPLDAYMKQVGETRKIKKSGTITPQLRHHQGLVIPSNYANSVIRAEMAKDILQEHERSISNILSVAH